MDSKNLNLPLGQNTHKKLFQSCIIVEIKSLTDEYFLETLVF
jgi:hypothetical protein